MSGRPLLDQGNRLSPSPAYMWEIESARRPCEKARSTAENRAQLSQ